MCWLRVIFVIFPLTLLLERGSSKQERGCLPSSCGKISNISYPFRLKEDPQGCGDSRYELACENNVTTLYLYSAKYHVQSINYNNFTIRVADPGVQQSNCSSMPLNFLSRSNFCDTYEDDNHKCNDPYHAIGLLFEHIVYMNCTHPVTNNPNYVETASCVNWKSKGYIYAISGDLVAEDFEVGCHVKFVAPTSLWGFSTYDEPSNYDVMHRALVFGFEVSWMHFSCQDFCGTADPQFCSFNNTIQKLQCHHSCFHFPGYEHSPCGIWTQLRSYAKEHRSDGITKQKDGMSRWKPEERRRTCAAAEAQGTWGQQRHVDVRSKTRSVAASILALTLTVVLTFSSVVVL